jgi:hypothetical protein
MHGVTSQKTVISTQIGCPVMSAVRSVRLEEATVHIAPMKTDCCTRYVAMFSATVQGGSINSGKGVPFMKPLGAASCPVA